MIDQPSSDPGDKIVDAVKQANKVIQSRFIFIGLLMIIAISLIFLRIQRERKIEAEYNGKYSLDYRFHLLAKMQDTSDLEAYIKRNADDMQYLKNVDNGVLLLKLKNSDYKDRLPIAEEMTKTLKTISEFEDPDPKIFKEPTNIGGINIPIELWLYFIPFVLAVFFRDLGKVFAYRRTMLDRFNEIGLEEWQQGLGLLGFQVYPPDNGIFRISRIFDVIISSILLLMPLACTLLFVILISYSPHSFGVILGELICTLSIGVDLLLIFYRENILGFRALVDLSSGKSYLNIPGKRYISFMIWIIIPILAYGITSSTTYIFYEQEEWGGMYQIIIVMTALLLSICLWLCHCFRENKTLVRMRFTLFVMNIYWIFIGLFIWFTRKHFGRIARGYASHNFIEILLRIAIITYLISLYVWPIRLRKKKQMPI